MESPYSKEKDVFIEEPEEILSTWEKSRKYNLFHLTYKYKSLKLISSSVIPIILGVPSPFFFELWGYLQIFYWKG